MILSVFELKKSVVLALFNCWPKAFSYTCKTRCKESYSLRVALQKLDYHLQKQVRQLGTLLQSAMPSNSIEQTIFYFYFYFNEADKPSAHNKKKVWKERVTLAKSPRLYDIATRFPINSHRISNNRDTSQHQASPFWIKPQLLHNFLKT